MPTRPDPSAADQAANPAHPASSSGVPFETLLAELNELVSRLESGGLGLSDSIGAYERGVTILRHLHDQLADVEERVRLLVRIDEQGRPILATTGAEEVGQEPPAPLKSGRPQAGSEMTDGDATSRRPPRSAARIGRPKRLPGMDDAGEEV